MGAKHSGWRVRRGAPGAVGLVLGLIVLGPALAPGFVLTYDMVFVPDPPATPAMFGLTGGFPRPVPSDAVVAGLAVVLPAEIVQKLVLLSIFVLAAWGAARLVPARHPLPRLAAAVFYTWNPYVAERLLLGHWALLLGYAGLPWAARAAVSVGERGGAARLIRSLVPAAVGGFAAMNISALVVVSVVAVRPRRRRERLRGERISRRDGVHDHDGGVFRRVVPALLVLVGLSLPWLVPAVLQQFTGRGTAYGTDPAGVDLFAARADTPFGSLGSLLSLGGIWNGEVVPPGLGAWPGAAARLALSLIAIAFFAAALRGPLFLDDHAPGVGTNCKITREMRGLAVAAGTGLLIACLGITAPGRAVLRRLIDLWPAFGVLRDAQVWVAPLALVEAIGLGLAVAALIRRPGTEARLLAGLVAVAPVVLLPTLAWGVAGRLDPVRYPADWAVARRTIERDPVPGAVLSLPWAAHRQPAWNGHRTTFDPLPVAVSRRVVWNDGLRVGGHALAPEDSAARRADALLRTPGDLTAGLRRAGFRFVVIARDPAVARDENAFQGRLAGAQQVLNGADLAVYRIPSPATFAEVGAVPPGFVLAGTLITVSLTLWSFGASGSNLVAYVLGSRSTRE
jgi:hypothetical protein